MDFRLRGNDRLNYGLKFWEEGDTTSYNMENVERRLKYLAILRHGDDKDGVLTALGRDQYRDLGGRLKQFMNRGDEAMVFTSVSQRAQDSSRFLAGALKAPVVIRRILLTGNDYSPRPDVAYELVESIQNSFDFVALVTHYELTEHFPEYCARGFNFPRTAYFNIGKGEGVLLDIRAQSALKLEQTNYKS